MAQNYGKGKRIIISGAENEIRNPKRFAEYVKNQRALEIEHNKKQQKEAAEELKWN